MQRLASASAGVSRERVWLGNVRKAERDTLKEASPWQYKESGDASVSLEMGLHVHQNFEEN